MTFYSNGRPRTRGNRNYLSCLSGFVIRAAPALLGTAYWNSRMADQKARCDHSVHVIATGERIHNVG